MESLVSNQAEPNEADITIAGNALPHIKDYLARRPDDDAVRLVVDGEAGETLVVPRGAVDLLARILVHMAAGHGVSVVPHHAELTTQQAAGMLNVSRPFLIGLLDAGEIEYRRVGAHRRIKASSLLDYKRHDDQRRRKAADDLSALNQDLGLD